MKLYLDSAYIAKCYLRERGTDAVLDLVESSTERHSSALALVEVTAVFHRHLREGRLTRNDFRRAVKLFSSDRDADIWTWIPLTDNLARAAASELTRLPPAVFLRSADCLHLTAARHAGFNDIYSNDRHMLNAAAHFGLEGRDVIAGD